RRPGRHRRDGRHHARGRSGARDEGVAGDGGALTFRSSLGVRRADKRAEEGVALMLFNSTLRAHWLLLTLVSAGVIVLAERQQSHLDLIINPARAEPLHKISNLNLRLSIRSRMLGEGINSAALSPDGNHVAIASLLSRHIIIWDIKNNREHL